MTSSIIRATTHSSPSNTVAAKVAAAVSEIRSGNPVVLVDSRSPGKEGDLVFAGAMATPKLMAFAIRHSSGFLCVALPEAVCDALRLPPMYTQANDDSWHGACCVTVDAICGTTTGISAADRATTTRALADSSTQHTAFTRPGHVVPVRTRSSQLLTDFVTADAAARLVDIAGLAPVSAFARIVSTLDPTRMARESELHEFARRHDLAELTVDDLVFYELTRPPDCCKPQAPKGHQ